MKLADVLPSLTRYGLSADADVVFRTLTGEPRPATVAGLARALGSARARIQGALAELAAAGVAVEAAGGGWVAVASDRAVTHLALRRTAETGSPGVRRIRSGEMWARSRQLFDATSNEQLAMYADPTVDEETARRSLPGARARRQRGIRLRTIAPVGATAPDLTTDELDLLDGDHRQLVEVPTSLTMLDRRVALLPIDPADPDGDYLEVRAAALVAGLHALFERHWAAARTPEASPLTTRERAVVALLAQGCTDAVVARRLGVSERTVTSVVRSLLDRYDAHSRFQLALALADAR